MSEYLYKLILYIARIFIVSLQVEEYLERFRLSLEKLQEVSARLRKDLIRGLGKHSHHKAPVKMLPTFVRATPDGTGEDDYTLVRQTGNRVLHSQTSDGKSVESPHRLSLTQTERLTRSV